MHKIGGILSPLLSNIVLNELDWWIASQWEFFPLEENKRKNKNYYLKNSKLKKCYIVRYADDCAPRAYVQVVQTI